MWTTKLQLLLNLLGAPIGFFEVIIIIIIFFVSDMRPGTVARFLVGGSWELDVSDVIDKITLKKRKKNLERNNLDVRHKNLALFDSSTQQLLSLKTSATNFL